MNRETMSPVEERAALDKVGAARAQIADVGLCPPWRHAAFGAVMSLLILGLGFPLAVQVACLCLAMGLMALIVVHDRRRYGMFINGYRRGKTRWVAFGILLVWLPLYAIAVHYGLTLHDHVVPLLLGALGFVIGTIGSMLWQRVFVSEMGA